MAERRSPSSSSTLVFQWLESIGLDYSVDHFRALGIDTPDKFAAFSLPDYDLVGVTDAEDRKRLFFLVQRVKVAVEERAKKKAEKHHAAATTGTLGRTGSAGRVTNTVSSPPTPSSKPSAPAEGGAGLSRSMREQVLNVDLSAMHALDGGEALHSGAQQARSGASPQQQPRRSSLDDSALDISASATPSPFRHDVQLGAGTTHATAQQPPPPPAYYLPTSASKQLSASALPGSSPMFASPASVLSSSTNAAVVASPEGPAARTTAGGRGLLAALGGASSHKRKTSAHHHQQTRAEGLVDMISDGPRDDMAIRVVVRKRPLTQTERNRGDTDIIESQPPQTVVVNEPKRQLDLTPFTESHYFVFDHSFDHLTPNEQIYGEVCLPLVAAMFRGGRSTCFAYGQTGSGKTFTMMGSGSTGHNERAGSGQSPASLSATASAPFGASGGNSGLYELAAQDIFQVMAHPRFAARGWSLHVSFYEIYGGKLFDLLNRRGVVRCLEDAKQQVQFLGLSEKHVRNVEELLGIMAEGQRQRSTGSTAANADSSRSHAVLQLSLKAPVASSSSSPSTSSPVRAASGKSSVGGSSSGGGRSTVRVIRESGSGDKGKQPVVGTFSFIDLAGSERGADTRHADKATRLEGAEINTSLLALKEVIRALDKKQTHTPFRGSKLTQVLKDSLVGANARTVMVACIAPSLSSCEHTLNTLRYADRVKEQDATQQQQQQQATAALSSTMNGTLRVPPSPAPIAAATTATITSSKTTAPAPTQSTLTREGSFSPTKSRAPAVAPTAPTGAGNNQRDAALASALEEAKEVQLYVQQLKELRSKTRQERSRSRSQSQSQSRLLHSLSSSSSSSAGSVGDEEGEVEEEVDERQQQLEAYREATQCLLETHKHAHLQLLNHLREEVDLLHVMDGDRGNLEAYLDSVERLLEEQDQELERIQAHLEHVKAAKRTLIG